MHSNEAEGLTVDLPQPSNAPHKHHCTTISLSPSKVHVAIYSVYTLNVEGPSTDDPHGIENRKPTVRRTVALTFVCP